MNIDLWGYWKDSAFTVLHPAQPAIFTILNPGGKELKWEVGQDVKWITLSPVEGQTSRSGRSSVKVDIHPESIKEPGGYEGYVTVFSNAATEPPIVTVRLLVSELTIPKVSDEGSFTKSTDTLKAKWLYSEREGISEYQYRITKSSRGGIIIKDWTSVGTETSVTVGELSLENGLGYYFQVKAKNNAGVWSEIGYSDGIFVDSIGPDITNSTPSPQKVKQPLLFQAMVRDSFSRVKDVYLRVKEKEREEDYSMRYNPRTGFYERIFNKHQHPINISYRILAKDNAGNETTSETFTLEVIKR